MTIEIMTYEDKFRGDLKLMLGDYLHLVAKEVKHEPWKFEINVLEAVDFTFKNLSDFVPPNGKIFIAKKSSECVGTASLKKIRPKIAEIKRMYVKPEFQGNGIGNFLLEKALEEAESLNVQEVFWIVHHHLKLLTNYIKSTVLRSFTSILRLQYL